MLGLIIQKQYLALSLPFWKHLSVITTLPYHVFSQSNKTSVEQVKLCTKGGYSEIVSIMSIEVSALFRCGVVLELLLVTNYSQIKIRNKYFRTGKNRDTEEPDSEVSSSVKWFIMLSFLSEEIWYGWWREWFDIFFIYQMHFLSFSILPVFSVSGTKPGGVRGRNK